MYSPHQLIEFLDHPPFPVAEMGPLTALTPTLAAILMASASGMKKSLMVKDPSLTLVADRVMDPCQDYLQGGILVLGQQLLGNSVSYLSRWFRFKLKLTVLLCFVFQLIKAGLFLANAVRNIKSVKSRVWTPLNIAPSYCI